MRPSPTVRCTTQSPLPGRGCTKWRVRNSGRTAKFQPSTDLQLLTHIPHPGSLRSPTSPRGGRYALRAFRIISNDFRRKYLHYQLSVVNLCIMPRGQRIFAGEFQPSKTAPINTTDRRPFDEARSLWGYRHRRCGCAAFYSRHWHRHKDLPQWSM